MTGVRADERPNIVFFLADDWSWPHAGFCCDSTVKTPHMDGLAEDGVHFLNAFVSTPSCTPSRLSILTGQHHWRLKEGDSLGGSLRTEYGTYPELLEEAGYRIGRFGKGVWPSQHSFRGKDTFGERFRNFEEFLETRESGQPFCYLHGGQDPHRPYEKGVGEKSGIDLDSIKVPPWMPDDETVRSDLADYHWEVQRFDREIGEVLAKLQEIGELENTLIVVSGDNGMPFPRAKATLYDAGIRVPLIVAWGLEVAAAGREVSDLVSLCDLAPTFMEAAGLEPLEGMTGRSLMPLLKSEESGRIDETRDHILAGMEQHVYPWPSRVIRTDDFLYILNFAPTAWRTGEEEGADLRFDFAEEAWPREPGAFCFNVDPSPTKQQMLELGPDHSLYEQAFGTRPLEEFYDLRKDPHQLKNVALEEDYEQTRRSMAKRLVEALTEAKDPRLRDKSHLRMDMHGWTIHLSIQQWLTSPEAIDEMLRLMDQQLERVVGAVPQKPLNQLRQVRIWINPPYSGSRPTAEYHPLENWLRKNGRDIRMHQGIEFTNARIFPLENRRMPWVVLHELAHAYHDQVLGFNHPPILDAYEKAKESGSYESVKRFNGESIFVERAYALTNHKEYFAEITEAYFGKNDFYPFTAVELKEHDPAGYRLMEQIWGPRR